MMAVSHSKDFNLLEMFEKLKNVEFHDPMKPQPLHGWTDEMCLIEGQKCCIWREIPEQDVEGHLISFVNLWFANDSESSDAIRSTIRNVLLMTPLGKKNKLLLRNVLDSAIETAKTPPAVEGNTSTIKEPLLHLFDPKDKGAALAFYNWLKTHLNMLKTLGETCPEGQPRSSKYHLVSRKLRAVLGFCALLLMRLLTKSEAQVKRCFNYALSKTFDQLFPDVKLNVLVIAPVPKFLKSASQVLTKNSGGPMTINLLHLLVFQYLKSTTEDNESSRLTRRILDEGCLKVMEGNGIGLVTLFQDVKLIYSNIEERQLLSMIAMQNGDAKSLERLTNFLDIYSQPEKPQYSWKWARILSQNYFSDLNIKENQFLCSKFAVFLMDVNPGIFQHNDLKSKNDIMKIAIEWAESVKEKLMKINNDRQRDIP